MAIGITKDGDREIIGFMIKVAKAKRPGQHF
nr:transposase [Staphylococcus aureus]